MKENIVDLLKKIPIFGSFEPKELKTTSKFMNLVNVKQDEVLFNEGDQGDYICFVVNGRLNVYKKIATEKEIILNTLSRGQSFGEMSGRTIGDSIA